MNLYFHSHDKAPHMFSLKQRLFKCSFKGFWQPSLPQQKPLGWISHPWNHTKWKLNNLLYCLLQSPWKLNIQVHTHLNPVTKHSSKQKWKRNYGEYTRICLLILGNTICINYFLEISGKFICSEICGRQLLCIQQSEYISNLWVTIHSCTMQCILNLISCKYKAPSLNN